MLGQVCVLKPVSEACQLPLMRLGLRAQLSMQGRHQRAVSLDSTGWWGEAGRAGAAEHALLHACSVCVCQP